ncbi:cupin domain-containing protein [Rhodococcus sp. NPDC056960]|uniref:cupin domain-containing protein n=1 Tax=Rhodococcus sp. NPDC056960 TaxID=3345982 RepID=UPI00362FCFC3
MAERATADSDGAHSTSVSASHTLHDLRSPTPVGAVPIVTTALPDAETIEGQPWTGTTALLSFEQPVEVGVWEMTQGTCRDVEIDEFFLVLSGRATVTVNGGPPLALTAGVGLRLHAGDRTIWVVESTLRKIYIAQNGN